MALTYISKLRWSDIFIIDGRDAIIFVWILLKLVQE